MSVSNQAIQLIETELRVTGYSDNLVLRNYPYASLSGSGSSSHKAELAAFAQAPPSALTACIGIATPESSINDLRSLGAAILIEVEKNAGRRWMNTASGPKLLDAKPIPLSLLFSRYRDQWEPNRIFRAKSIGAVDQSAQLDFVDIGLLPALETEAREKLDTLIREVANAANHTYKKIHFGELPDEGQLFRLLFTLITAKVLRDTEVLPGLDFSNPRELFRQVQHYNPFPDVTPFDDHVLREAASHIAGSFPFSNLSVDTLAYVYENTLVNQETRKRLSVHYTPSYVAEYLVSRLPLNSIDPDHISVCDPMCGHGTFLVAAMRRLRALLPVNWSPEERHNYFITHLSGRDIDPFSVEVAKLTLTLADLPNPNGWDVKQADAYRNKALEVVAGNTTVFLSNPPYEMFTAKERVNINPSQATKAAEMLIRVLPNIPENALVGIALPIKFLEGKQYKRARTIIDEQFELLELLMLPDKVFEKSESETVLLMARKSHSISRSRNYMINYRSVAEQDLEAFKLHRGFTRDESLPAEVVLSHQRNALATFWVPRLYSVWDTLANNRCIMDVAHIHNGVEYASGLLSHHREELIRENEFLYSFPGVDRIDDQLLPFHMHNVRWLSTDPDHKRQKMLKAWGLPWNQPKVLLNGARRSRGPWRVIAACDRTGLLAIQSFQAAWVKEGISTLFLAAFLNSAFANAFIYDHELDRNNSVKVLECIPIPPLTKYLIATVQEIAEECEKRISEDPTSDLTTLMINLDAELLRAYDLAPRDEKRLLDIFSGTKRPGCPSFEGFYPKGFSPAVPLHEYISPDYRAARGAEFLSRLKVVDDPVISASLHEIRGSNDDE